MLGWLILILYNSENVWLTPRSTSRQTGSPMTFCGGRVCAASPMGRLCDGVPHAIVHTADVFLTRENDHLVLIAGLERGLGQRGSGRLPLRMSPDAPKSRSYRARGTGRMQGTGDQTPPDRQQEWVLGTWSLREDQKETSRTQAMLVKISCHAGSCVARSHVMPDNPGTWKGGDIYGFAPGVAERA